MLVIGLTGSIGMGKSTTARLFGEQGAAVHDSDAAVHALYSGDAAPLIEAAFPGTTREGMVDRKELGTRVLGDAKALEKLERIVHPLVRTAELAFLEKAREAQSAIAVVDIPLLFETGRENDFDRVVVASAGLDEQRRRVMERPGMTEETFARILARQLPDSEKRARADVVIDTSRGIDDARVQVRAALRSFGTR